MDRESWLDVERRPARDIHGAGGLDQMRQIECRLESPIGRSGCSRVAGSSWSRLASRHRIDKVVDADHLEVDIAARGVNQMIAADGRKVAVARVDHYIEVGIGKLQSGGKRNRAPVRGVERVKLHVSSHAARAADSGDKRQSLKIDFGFDQRLGKAVDGRPDAASRAPDVRHAVACGETVLQDCRAYDPPALD